MSPISPRASTPARKPVRMEVVRSFRVSCPTSACSPNGTPQRGDTCGRRSLGVRSLLGTPAPSASLYCSPAAQRGAPGLRSPRARGQGSGAASRGPPSGCRPVPTASSPGQVLRQTGRPSHIHFLSVPPTPAAQRRGSASPPAHSPMARRPSALRLRTNVPGRVAPDEREWPSSPSRSSAPGAAASCSLTPPSGAGLGVPRTSEDAQTPPSSHLPPQANGYCPALRARSPPHAPHPSPFALPRATCRRLPPKC